MAVFSTRWSEQWNPSSEVGSGPKGNVFRDEDAVSVLCGDDSVKDINTAAWLYGMLPNNEDIHLFIYCFGSRLALVKIIKLNLKNNSASQHTHTESQDIPLSWDSLLCSYRKLLQKWLIAGAWLLVQRKPSYKCRALFFTSSTVKNTGAGDILRLWENRDTVLGGG